MKNRGGRKMNNLKAKLGFKGERGYSAYEIAVQNGFEGTEQDWLATLGTSSHLTQDTVSYTSIEGQTDFNLPTSYTSDTFVDVYVDGLRLTFDEYTITNNKVVLTNGLTSGRKVEIVEMTMSTNSLPIVTSVDSESTDDTVLSAKGSYGLKQLINEHTSQIGTLANDISTLSTNLDDSINELNTNLDELSDKLTDGGIYSTQETLTNNNWINGKPIYRKVFNVGTVAKETIKKISYGVPNLGQVVDLRGFNEIDDENHTRLNFAVPINFFNIYQHHVGEAENGQHCFVTKTEQAIEFYSTWDVHDLVIIMEYTKAEAE